MTQNTPVDKLKAITIKDNIGYGEHDWDALANEWDAEQLKDWGLDVWQEPVEVDYSLLDEEDLSNELKYSCKVIQVIK